MRVCVCVWSRLVANHITSIGLPPSSARSPAQSALKASTTPLPTLTIIGPPTSVGVRSGPQDGPFPDICDGGC